jgi:hypothetical protein
MSERRETPNDVSELGVVVVDLEETRFLGPRPNEDPQQAPWSMTRPIEPMTNLQMQDRPNFSDTTAYRGVRLGAGHEEALGQLG